MIFGAWAEVETGVKYIRNKGLKLIELGFRYESISTERGDLIPDVIHTHVYLGPHTKNHTFERAITCIASSAKV